VLQRPAPNAPAGLADLFAVCQAVRGAPVLARDWFLHPLQIVDAKEAGAAGVTLQLAEICYDRAVE